MIPSLKGNAAIINAAGTLPMIAAAHFGSVALQLSPDLRTETKTSPGAVQLHRLSVSFTVTDCSPVRQSTTLQQVGVRTRSAPSLCPGQELAVAQEKQEALLPRKTLTDRSVEEQQGTDPVPTWPTLPDNRPLPALVT
ncbi:unnamed protein product [Pleuronectes platessa]|uniref:Uncharacterized protein n=1 Tax=Pleuronectes platessa TaxID=8262 RepID=A0A9N7UA88_PLEPL|nr:unnamed protein product [Pleuronectes platessa]